LFLIISFLFVQNVPLQVLFSDRVFLLLRTTGLVFPAFLQFKEWRAKLVCFLHTTEGRCIGLSDIDLPLNLAKPEYKWKC